MGEHIQLTVNGTTRDLDVEPRRLLVQALREDLDLTGTQDELRVRSVHDDGSARSTEVGDVARLRAAIS